MALPISQLIRVSSVFQFSSTKSAAICDDAFALPLRFLIVPDDPLAVSSTSDSSVKVIKVGIIPHKVATQILIIV
jgi:Phosphotransferase enzyme family